jgi:hypothetical protein
MSTTPLVPYLITLRRRLRLRDGWLLAQSTLWIPLVAGIGILLTGRLLPIEDIAFWVFAPITLWLCANLLYSGFRPRPLENVAQEADLELGLKERLSTATELAGKNFRQEPGSPVHQLPAYQKNDALIVAKSIQPRHAFPLLWLSRPLIVAAGLLATTLVLIYLPNPMEAILAERAAVEDAAQEQAEKIEEIKDEIEQNQDLSPEIQAELLRQLDELTQQLRNNPGDREKALADLSKLEEELRRQIDPNADLQQQSLEAISSQLQSLAQQEDANPLTPTEALEQIASELANMSESERQDLAEALAQMAAQAAQVGNTDLAQSLAAMSQAALSGNTEAASQAAGDTSQALVQSQQALSDQQTLQQALDQLQNSSQAMAQAGQPGQQMAGQQPGQNAQGSSPGQNPGQGQSGQGLSGGGTKADTLHPGTGSGQAGRPEDVDTGGASGELGDQVFIPWDRRGSEGEEVSIPGQDTGQGETITRENPNPSGGLPGDALIPYQQVYTQYFNAAQQAMNRSEIPLVYRDLVRDYFTQLEP